MSGLAHGVTKSQSGRRCYLLREHNDMEKWGGGGALIFPSVITQLLTYALKELLHDLVLSPALLA